MFTVQKINYTNKMGKIRQIKIELIIFYNDIIDLKKFKSILLKIDKKSYKNISIYNIGYITIKMMIVKIFTV